jgi:hypothetical protein
MKPWHVLLILIPLCGYLLFKISSLDDRVELLYGMVQIKADTEKSDDGEEVDAGNPEAERIAELENQVEKIEARLDAVAETATIAAEQPAPEPSSTPVTDLVKSDGFDEYVVGVMRNEVNKIRDEQLIQHRDFLMDNRTKAVRNFAKQHGLTRHQEAAVLALMADEADQMVEILKSPDITEDLPRAMDRWKEMLAKTDEEVGEVLDEKQMGVYLYLRRVEQQVLMPWLPK